MEQYPHKAIRSGSQCDKQQNEDILEELMAVWQQHGERLEQIAQHHDLSQFSLAPSPKVASANRRSVFVAAAVTLVCIATIVGMVVLRRNLISDIFDLLFFLLLGIALVFTAIQNVLLICTIRRQFSTEAYRCRSVSPLRYSIHRAAVLASVVVLFLFIVIPVQNGRTMSHTSLSQRNAAVANVSHVLTQL